jgi:TonB family protein
MSVIKLGISIAATVSLAACLAAHAKGADPVGASDSAASDLHCGPVEYPLDGAMYGLEGVTVVEFTLGANGVPADVQVRTSSGWKVLDTAALAIVRNCKVDGVQPQQAVSRQTVQYIWSLDAPRSRQALVPGSCAPSDRFAGFAPFDRRPSSQEAVLVRTLVRADGQIHYAEAENDAAAPDAAIAALALNYLRTCRFALSAGPAGPLDESIFGRVLLK